MFDAIYTRQSVDKADSISIESQLEYCKYEARGSPYKSYSDKGYSGKNTNRPAFEEMLRDIKEGKISRVIVYKLDRISRSILDFANMMEVFSEHNVEFVSSTERFDTSTPIGRAMLNICIVFAQLERETIQKRVSDAYYSRSKRGFYMGGRIPYGFGKAGTEIDGIKTSMYVPVPEEAEQIKLMYSMYADEDNSLGDIIEYFNKNGIKHLRGGMWSVGRISEMLRNPIYVMADADVYDFFKSQGADIINPVSDYTGYNACYLYQGTVSKTRKQLDLKDKEIVLAPHCGIVPSGDWLKCRIRCLNNRQSTKTCKGTASWLTGKVKCGKCGYALMSAHSNGILYMRCTVHADNGACPGCGCVKLHELEAVVYGAMVKKLKEFKTLTGRKRAAKISPKLAAKRLELAQVESESENLLDTLTGASPVLLSYANSKIEELDARRQSIANEIAKLSADAVPMEKMESISGYLDDWENVSFEDKRKVVDALITVIRATNEKVEIEWKI